MTKLTVVIDEKFLSEDLQAGRRFGDLEVVKPFDPSAHAGAAGYAFGARKPVPKARKHAPTPKRPARTRA